MCPLLKCDTDPNPDEGFFFLELLKLRIIACLQLKKCYVASHDNQRIIYHF